MKSIVINNLISALSQAFLVEFNKGFHGDVFDHDPGEKSGLITVATGPVISAMFKPVDGVVANCANITFSIYFIGCTYSEETKDYLWDGKEHEVHVGDYNPNILFAKHEQGEGEPDWGNCDSDDTLLDNEDVNIAQAVVHSVFKSMTDERKSVFLQNILSQTNKELKKSEADF